MQHRLEQLTTKSRILKSVLIFFLAYLILLILWLQVKETYGYGVTLVASKFVAEVKDAQLEEVIKERNIIKASFRSSKGEKDFSVALPIKIDAYASNLPLTLSVLASLYPFIRRKKRAYTEALLLLVLFHLLYVFLGEILQLTNIFMAKGVEKGSFIRLSVYHFVWGVTDYASMSFVPFLLVTYIFVRFRR
jgi:hypothetical protein